MKTKILFVDDDEIVIADYRRMLFSMLQDWEFFFALSVNEALEILSKNEIDVVVSDLWMPEMNGVDFFIKIKNIYPKILRIFLSEAHQDMWTVHNTKIAHQLIIKPAKSEFIQYTIEMAYKLRNNIQNNKFLEQISLIKELPNLPEIYLNLIEELKKKDVSLNRVAEIISKDKSISEKILKTVNSKFFGLGIRITDLMQALNFLGINTIKAILLQVSIFSSKNLSYTGKRFSELISNHCISVGTIARKISSLETQDKTFRNEAFMAGVLHDIGKFILLSLPGYEEKFFNELNAGNPSYNLIEYENYGFSHAEVGAYLLGMWGLPRPIVEGTAFHHQPSILNDCQFTPLTAVHIADVLINIPPELLNKMASIRFSGVETDRSDYTQLFSIVDFNYLEKINCLDKFDSWVNLLIKSN